MTTSFHNAIAAAQAAVRSTCGETVTYHRGNTSVEVTEAVAGSSRFEADDGSGVIVTSEVRDFLIAADKLVLDGQLIAPQRGDQIKRYFDEKILVYEVTGPGGEKHFRPSGPTETTLRIHTRHIDTEAI